MASFAEKDFGQKVKLPPWERLDPSKIQTDTTAGNQAVLPSAMELGTLVNQYNMDELERMFGMSQSTFKKISDNIAAQARGEIPDDVQQLLQTNAATKSLYGGFGGTQAARNLTARDFGSTSLAIKQQGLDSASRWLQVARANTFDVTSMFLNPEQRYGIASNERDLAWKHAYLKAQIEAAPDPATRGIMDAVRNGTMYMSGGWNGTYQTPQAGNQGGVGGDAGSRQGGEYDYLIHNIDYYGNGGGGSGGGGGNPDWENQNSPQVDWGQGFDNQWSGFA